MVHLWRLSHDCCFLKGASIEKHACLTPFPVWHFHCGTCALEIYATRLNSTKLKSFHLLFPYYLCFSCTLNPTIRKTVQIKVKSGCTLLCSTKQFFFVVAFAFHGTHRSSQDRPFLRACLTSPLQDLHLDLVLFCFASRCVRPQKYVKMRLSILGFSIYHSSIHQ